VNADARLRDLLRLVLVTPLRRRFRAELLWALVGVPVNLLPLIPLLAGLALGIGLTPIFLGFLLLGATVFRARALGGRYRGLARRLLGVRIVAPPSREMRPGLWNWVRARAADPSGWRVMAYVLIRLPLALVELGVTVLLLLYGLATLAYPVTWFLLDGQKSPMFNIYSRNWAFTPAIALLGLVVLLATPWILHALLGLDRLLAVGLLGASTLSERVRDLEESRATAVEDATVKLRRIERDLHDGAQARLVAVAMKLGAAKEEFGADRLNVDLLQSLVSAAHDNAKQALVELRDLARGIRPPALDAGLGVALSTLASTSAGDVRLRVDLPRRPPPSIETIVYFSAAELLTNAAKHSGPGPIGVDVTSADRSLRLVVSDSGEGGASLSPGGGLAGLADRVRTVDGRLEVDSPAGGPTVISVEIPLPT
jgi:signal transduction histidine kinase